MSFVYLAFNLFLLLPLDGFYLKSLEFYSSISSIDSKGGLSGFISGDYYPRAENKLFLSSMWDFYCIGVSMR